MKRFLFIMLCAFLMSCNCGCGLSRPVDLPNNSDQTEPWNPSEEHDSSDPEDPINKTLTMDIPELNLTDQIVYYTARGYVDRGSTVDYHKREVAVYIVVDHKENALCSPNMIVYLNQKTIVYPLDVSVEPDACGQGSLALADIDGDGNDEIILCMEINGNRATIARIYKIEGDALTLMADFNGAYQNDLTSEYGYEYRFIDNQYVELTNRFTGLHSVNDLSLVFTHMPFDEEVLNHEEIHFRKFDAHLQLDITSLGEVHLKYLQQLRMIDGPGVIGYIVTTLSYDNDLKDFVVLDADFIFNKDFYNWNA